MSYRQPLRLVPNEPDHFCQECPKAFSSPGTKTSVADPNSTRSHPSYSGIVFSSDTAFCS